MFVCWGVFVPYFSFPRCILSSYLFSRYVAMYLSIATSEQLKHRNSDDLYIWSDKSDNIFTHELDSLGYICAVET